MKDLDNITHQAQGYRHSGLVYLGVIYTTLKEWTGIDLANTALAEMILSSEALSTALYVGVGWALLHFKDKAESREPDKSLDDQIAEAAGRTGDVE